MNVGMPEPHYLALYISENALEASNDREPNSSLPIYHHVRGNTIAEKQQRIRDLLQNTISTDRLLYSPEFFTPIYKKGMNRILVKDSDRDYQEALSFLIQSNIDWDDIRFLDIRGPMSNEYFLCTSKFRNLREVTLEPASLFANPFRQLIKEQDLRTLKVSCNMDECIFQDMNEGNPFFLEVLDILQTYCTGLNVFDLSCTSREHETEVVSNIANLLRHIPHVKKIRFSTSVQAARELILELEDLRGLDFSLELDICVNQGEIICSFPLHHADIVKSVNVKHAGKREIMGLQRFGYLSKAELQLISGGETELATMPRENIETFTINVSPMAAVGNGLSYYEPSGNALRMAVSNMPRLKDLTLVNCRVAKKEVYKIMEYVGNRLESLEMSILDQEECPSQRLLDVCVANIKFNSRLRKLKVRDDLDEGFIKVLRWGTETFEVYRSLYRKLVHTRDLLTCTATLLDPWDLTFAIQSLVPHPNVISEVQESLSDAYTSSSITSDED